MNSLTTRYRAVIQSLIRFLVIGSVLLLGFDTGRADTTDISEKETFGQNLVIAIDENYSPQTFVDIDDQPTGIFVDIWRLWAEKTGTTITFLRGNWNDSLANLKSGRADIHSGLFHSDDRAQWIGFSKPFYGVGSYLFSLATSAKPDQRQTLAGKKIGATLGSFQEAYLRQKHPQVEVVAFTDRKEMIRAVLAEKIDALLAEGPAMASLLDRYGLTGRFFTGNVMFRKEFHAGVLKANKTLLEFINKGFDAISEQELAEIEKRWIHDPKRQYFKSELSYVLDAIPALVWIAKDPECRVITGNRYVNELFGVTRDTNVSQTTAKQGKAVKITHLSPEGIELQPEEIPMQLSIASGEPVHNMEFTYLFPDGRKIHAIGNAVPLFDEYGQIRGSVGAFLDITKTKQAAAQLQNRTQMLLIAAVGFSAILCVMLFVLARMWRSARQTQTELKQKTLFLDKIIASSAVSTWIADATGTAIRTNAACLELFGATDEEVIGKYNLFEDSVIQRNGQMPIVKKVFEKAQAANIVIDYDFAAVDHVEVKNATHKIINSILTPITDNQGRVTHVIVQTVDLTDIKQAELALKQSEAKHRALIENLSELIIILDNKGIIIWNSPAVGQYGLEPKDTEGLNVLEYIHPDDRARAVQVLKEVVDNPGKIITLECLKVVPRKGTTIYLDDTLVYLPETPGIQGIVVTCRDVTERRLSRQKQAKLEEQMRQSQKMEAIGTLAGGIAHDFNNMLGVITGNVSYAMSSLAKNDELYEVLGDIQASSKQAQTLTHQLLTFAKGGAPIKKIADINRLIRDSAVFAARGAKASCQFDLADDLWMAEIDEGQMNQAIGNLVINANQAMPNGGTVYMRTANADIKAEHALPLPSGRYIKIAVEDQGVGISKKHLPNIFEPYYTTKQKGSGLGLATAYSIIKRHEGHINVYSEIDKGTVFNIYLPASSKAVNGFEERQEYQHQGQGKILIMDDQEQILKMAARMLNQMGYETVSATDGARAIELYSDAYRSARPFDLVILDLTVPGGMGGAKAIPELLKTDPQVKAVVSSGYSNDPIMAHYEDYGFCGVVPKPYTKALLAEVLNNVLGKKDS